MRGSLDSGTSTAVRRDDIEPALRAGERALHFEGRLRESRQWFDAAYREAERRRDGRGMARAALGLGGLWVNERRRAADIAMVRVRQRDALSLIDSRSSLALRLRVRLAADEDFPAGEHGAIVAMVREARRADDAVALAEALNLAHQCAMGPDHGALRYELTQELIGEASKTDRRGDLLVGLLWHTVDQFLIADPRAERSLSELRALLAHDDHLAVGYVVSAIEVMLAIRAGRFDEAEAMAAVCAERGEAAGVFDVPGWHAAQVGTIRWFQGRIAELVPKLSELANSPVLSAQDNAGYAGLAVAAAAAGERRLAAGSLARLRNRVLADLPRTGSWLMSACCAVDVAHMLADARTAAQAYAALTPFVHLPAVLGPGIVCLGSIHRHLGVACLTMGDVDKAVKHLRMAVQDNLALAHWPAVVLSRARLGEALALRDGPNDPAALRELSLAAEEAAAIGMALPPDAPRHAAGPNVTGTVVCRRRGRQWKVELGGRTALVDDSVGMRHLAALLANPGYEIPAVELAAGPGLAEAPVATSAQPVLDDEAVRTYKKRLAQLQTDIDELESMNEFERAAAVRTEYDWLVAELAAAAGIGGRPRQFTGSEERARIAVGKAIRRAVKRVADADPVIGGELRATVHTGLRCCYRPA